MGGPTGGDPATLEDGMLLMQERNVEMLTEDKIKEITDWLALQPDSSAAVNFVTRKFDVKRLQLCTAGFSLSPTGRYSSVAPPGFPEPKPAPAIGEKDPLPQSMIAEISDMITSNGGSEKLSILGGAFTIKAHQLQAAGFVLGPVNYTGQRCVALPGSEEPAPPEDGVPGAKRQKQDRYRREKAAAEAGEPPELTEEEMERINQFLLAQENQSALCRVVSQNFGVKRIQLENAGFSLSPPGTEGRHFSVAPPGFPPPVAEDSADYEGLPEEKHWELLAFLEEEGGIGDMSIIGARFGLKAPQLEKAEFVLSEMNANGQRYCAAPGSDVPEPPPCIGGGGGKGKGKGFKGKKGGKEAQWQMMQCMSMMMAKGKMMGMPPPMMMAMFQGGMKGMKSMGKGVPAEMGKFASTMGKGVASEFAASMGKGMDDVAPVMGKGMASSGDWQGNGEGGVKRKRCKGVRPGTQKPPLTQEVADQVLALLAENGGVCSVPFLGSRFKIGRQQLEGAGFVCGPPNEKGQVSVAAPGQPPPAPPSHVPKSEEAAAAAEDPVQQLLDSMPGLAP